MIVQSIFDFSLNTEGLTTDYEDLDFGNINFDFVPEPKVVSETLWKTKKRVRRFAIISSIKMFQVEKTKEQLLAKVNEKREVLVFLFIRLH